VFGDWDLIISSFAQQYGIRLKNELSEMTYAEFCALLSGISSETALGRVISIRSENDREMLKHFTPEQRRIRSEWRTHAASSMSEEEAQRQLYALAAAFRGM
jgi:hypothetical protein